MKNSFTTASAYTFCGSSAKLSTSMVRPSYICIDLLIFIFQCQEDAVVDEARDSRKKYCGWKDVRSQKGLERVRRYAISGLLWSKKVI